MTKSETAAKILKPVDLGDLDTTAASDAGSEIELLHPTSKKPLGVFINVLGKHSQVFLDLINERTNARLKREHENRKRGKEDDVVTAEQVTARAVELLTLCTLGWRSETRDEKGNVVANEPTMTFKGEALAFSVANVKRIYENMIWVREQVDAGIGDLENFIKS